MSEVRVESFAISLDGFGAGPNQTVTEPLGVGGEQLHDLFIPTETFQRVQAGRAGTTGVDDQFASRGFRNIGAWIPGRKMFGPIRGPWPNEEWKGWWGNNPPYHVPVFVLTHHPRQPLEMEGGTTFHFVTAEFTGRSIARARPPATRTSASAVEPASSDSTFRNH